MVDDLVEPAESALAAATALLDLGDAAGPGDVEKAVGAIAHLIDNALRVLAKRSEAEGVDARYCGSCAVGAFEALFKAGLVEPVHRREELSRARSYLRDAKSAARPKADRALVELPAGDAANGATTEEPNT